ncbi:hypothetical protein CHS0354_014786 [Potamilus streckersoni]|uniref:Uncharacterized protein n=1 Tax=Potamilus streckersoni TaxID=2493646 RepID=A0AAE0VQS1_9BIVA|nr:hypothetical protein CHS0354_014786 [Potamilus streckersoni]
MPNEEKHTLSKPNKNEAPFHGEYHNRVKKQPDRLKELKTKPRNVKKYEMMLDSVIRKRKGNKLKAALKAEVFAENDYLIGCQSIQYNRISLPRIC